MTDTKHFRREGDLVVVPRSVEMLFLTRGDTTKQICDALLALLGVKDPNNPMPMSYWLLRDENGDLRAKELIAVAQMTKELIDEAMDDWNNLER